MELTQESFELLLSWLHPVRDEAGRMYVKIRAGLIRNFSSHGCSIPDRLSDITIDRVAQKVPKIIGNYVGEREPYFHRVAYYVLKEYFNHLIDEVEITPDLSIIEPHEDENDEIEPYFQCLDKCMARLPPEKQDLIRKYYRGDKATKIRLRKELAASLKIELSVLRVKALRIGQDLKKCTNHCLQKMDHDTAAHRV
jgi:hypothetical protein